ncbi:MAG: thiol:disulfide interchange protein DsbA/DsbL [Pseudomonadota bacterium]|nr:thiol:disulfide interchange protein DsbA/DsbL [Pseudomonadota bacterium]
MSLLSRCLFLLLSCLALSAIAQPRESVEGVHYFALPTPVPTDNGADDKIEVREVFWYGCKECSTLEPMMTTWRDGTTGDLVFVRMPAVLNELMSLHARIYYTGRELKLEDRINQAAYRAIHDEQNPLRNEEQIQAFFEANGVKADAFAAAWNSEAVNAAVQMATQRTQDYSIDKLPSMIVNGRYKLTHNAKLFNHVELNIGVNNVIRKLREERRANI